PSFSFSPRPSGRRRWGEGTKAYRVQDGSVRETINPVLRTPYSFIPHCRPLSPERRESNDADIPENPHESLTHPPAPRPRGPGPDAGAPARAALRERQPAGRPAGRRAGRGLAPRPVPGGRGVPGSRPVPARPARGRPAAAVRGGRPASGGRRGG